MRSFGGRRALVPVLAAFLILSSTWAEPLPAMWRRTESTSASLSEGAVESTAPASTTASLSLSTTDSSTITGSASTPIEPSASSSSSPTAEAESESASESESEPSTSTNPSSSSTPPRPLPTDTSFPVCQNATGPAAPFCLPEPGTEVWVGEQYHITWDSEAFEMESMITIELSYTDMEPGSGNVAWESQRTENSYGYVTLTMDEAWLRDEPRNNLTYYLIANTPGSTAVAKKLDGPTVTLTKKPAEHYAVSSGKKLSTLGLALGLPLGFGLVIVVAVALYFGMRRRRLIGLGNVMSRGRRQLRRGNGYGARQSRRERMKASKSIPLDDTVVRPVGDGAYRDEDAVVGGPRRAGEDGFRDEPTQGGGLRHNVFREEVDRQRQGRA